MSARAEAGKREWQERRATYGAELAEQITAGATASMAGWAAKGRTAWWIRFNARLRGHRVSLPGGTLR